MESKDLKSGSIYVVVSGEVARHEYVVPGAILGVYLEGCLSAIFFHQYISTYVESLHGVSFRETSPEECKVATFDVDAGVWRRNRKSGIGYGY